MAATISSTFVIDVTETLNNSAKVVTNPGRSFRILAVLATGVNTASVIVRKNSVSGAVAAGATALATGDLNDFPIAVSATLADTNFLSTDNIYISNTVAADITRVKILCEAVDGGQALTVT